MIDRRWVLAGLSASMLPVQAQARAGCTTGPYGAFDGAVLAEWLPDGRRMKLERALGYIGPDCARWGVPKGAVVDGASIPRFLWATVGGPFEGSYRAASVVHDYYCDVRKRPWRDVHRMFLTGMLAGGVDTVKANVMYAGVYWGGPRWSDTVVENNNINGAQIVLTQSLGSAPSSALLANAYTAGYERPAPPSTGGLFSTLTGGIFQPRPPVLSGSYSLDGASASVLLRDIGDVRVLEAVLQPQISEEAFAAVRQRIEAESPSMEQIEAMVDAAPR